MLSTHLLAQAGTALVERAPSINGQVEGSIQQMSSQTVRLNGGATITNELLVPGTPNVRQNGRPQFGGIIEGQGAAFPSNYQVTLNGNSTLGNLVRRTDPVSLPHVSAPPMPSGNHSVNINSNSESPGDFSTLKNLTLNGGVGVFAIPPGTYGNFTANGGSGFVLGTPGSTQPTVYNFQRLNLNGNTELKVVGPVVLNLAKGFNLNGDAGSQSDPEWLIFNIYSGGLNVNGSGRLFGFVNAPNGSIRVNGELTGGVASDRLTVNGGGLLRLQATGGGTNQPPVANDDAVSGNEDGSVSITLIATDADGDALTFTVVDLPAHGSLSGTAPNVVYTPAPDFNGTDQFTFQAEDALGTSNLATIMIAIAAINDRPVAGSQNLTVLEDVPVSVLLAGSDVEGDPLTFAILDLPINGQLTGSGENQVYVPAPNFAGTDRFTYTVSDGASTSTEGEILIQVDSVNDAPVAQNRSLAVNEGETVEVSLVATDVDGDPLTYEILSGPEHGTLTGSAPVFQYQPSDNYDGVDVITFRASDGFLFSNEAMISVAITNLNDPPTVAPVAVSTDEDTSVQFDLGGIDPDGDALVAVEVLSPGSGTLSINGTIATYTPAADFNGAEEFSFLVNDGEFDSGTVVASINVDPVNDAPVAQPDTVSLEEDSPTAIIINASDVDGDTLSLVVVNGPSHGILAGTELEPVYTPDENYFGPDQITVQVSDGTTVSEPVTIDITVAPVNDAPVVVVTPIEGNEDEILTFTLTVEDAENDPVSFQITVPPLLGDLVVSPQGEFVFTPALDANGADSFEVVASDASASSEPVQIPLNLIAVNDAPFAEDAAISTDRNIAVDLTLAATDVDGDALNYSITSSPSSGTLSGTLPNLTYTPNADFAGSDQFSFQANDGNLTSSVGTVSITVVATNRAPIALDGAEVLAEDTPASVTLVASDLDGDTIIYEIVDSPAHGTLTGVAPDLVYTPDENYFGTDEFSFRVNDGLLDSVLAIVTLTVTPVDDAPVAVPQALAVLEDDVLPILLSGSDPEGAALDFQISVTPQFGNLSGTAPNLVYTPLPNFNGQDGFEFLVGDGAQTDSASVTILLAPVNDAPVADAQTVTTSEDVPVTITLTATDVDGDTLSYTIEDAPSAGTLVGSGDEFVYSPIGNFNGSDGFTFSVSDGVVTSAVVNVAITVTAVNDAPIAIAQAVTTDEDNSVSIVLAGTDTDGDALSFVIVTGPSSGSLSGVAPNLVYSPDADFSGVDSFTFVASDGQTDSVPATLDLTINAVNDAPIVDDLEVSTAEDTPVDLNIVTSDAEGDTLTLSVAIPPAHGALSGDPFAPTYTPNENYFGPDSFTVQVDDGSALSAEATVTLDVLPVNDAPVVASEAQVTNEDQVLAFTLSANDVEGDALTYTVTAGPAEGTVSVSAIGEVTYTPFPDFNGDDNFEVVANDGAADSVPAIITVSVASINDVPVAEDQTVELDEDTSTAITVAATDVDGDTLTFALQAAPTNGVLSGTAPNYTYTPNGNFHGSDAFTFTVSDGSGSFASGTVSITVLPVNDAPVADDQQYAVIGTNLIALSLTGSDVDGDSLAFVIQSPPANGSLIGSPPSVSYQANPGFIGTDSFVFYANDGIADSASATVSIEVEAPLNSAPLVDAGDDASLVIKFGQRGVNQIVVNNDEWTFSDFGLDRAPSASNFALNIADQFSGGENGSFLVYSDDFGLVEEQLEQLMTSAGHSWEITTTLPLNLSVLKGYDGVFLNAEPVDNQLLIEYVEAGGNVYVCGGRANGSDAEAWNTFLAHFGLGFGGTTPIIGTIPVTVVHPLFDGVLGLYYQTGDSVILTESAGSQAMILQSENGAGLIGLWSGGVASIQLIGSALDDNLPNPPQLDYQWSQLAGPSPARMVSSQTPDTEVIFDAPGTYVFELAVNDGESIGTDSVVVDVIENNPPVVDPGLSLVVPNSPDSVGLSGSVGDDGQIAPLGVEWSQIAGASTLVFEDSSDPTTSVSVPQDGLYVLRLTADDGLEQTEGLLELRAGLRYDALLPDDMVAWWPLNGDNVDRVAGLKLGVAGQGQFVASQVGLGLDFDGVVQGPIVTSSPAVDLGNSSNGFSIELWVNRATNFLDVPLLHWQNGSDSGLGLWITDSGRRLSAYLREADGNGPAVGTGQLLPEIPWFHVALTYDRLTGETRLYVDGVLAAEADRGVSVQPFTSGDIEVGSWRLQNRFFQGELDEITLYNRSLDPGEIALIHAAGAAGKAPLDGNSAPIVDAGSDISTAGASISLNGSVVDDDQPLPGALAVQWDQIDGPGLATFVDASDPDTSVSFSQPGTYLLKLSGDDGSRVSSDLLVVRTEITGHAPLLSELAAWWPTNGEPHEVINGKRDVVLFNGAGYAPGQVSQGFIFDGVDDHGRIAASPNFDIGSSAAGFTIELWVNRDTNVSDAPLVLWENGAGEGLSIRLGANGTGLAAFLVSADGQLSLIGAVGLFPENVWTHVALTYDRTTGVARIVRNGVVALQQNIGAGKTMKTDEALQIGSLRRESRYYNGLIDELSLYHRPLEVAELQAIHAAGSAGKPPAGPLNTAPTVDLGADIVASSNVAIPLVAAVTDDGLPDPPSALTFLWTKQSGPGNVAVTSLDSPTTTATFDTLGTYVLRLTANDGELDGFDEITVNVVDAPTNSPPLAGIFEPGDSDVILADTYFEIAARVTDDVSIAKVEFFSGSTKLGEQTLPSAGDPEVYFWPLSGGLPTGDYDFTVVATDDAGLSSVSPVVSVTVSDDPALVGASTFIENPLQDARISAPTEVSGVIASGSLSSWSLQYRLRPSGDDTSSSLAPWIDMATGTDPVGTPATDTAAPVSGVIGTFDPTMLINGIYEIRLSVDSAIGTTAYGPITVVVEGNMKIGNFSIAFEDLSVPTAGIPISVTRTYDSRDQRVGDFGPGWWMAIGNVRVQKNRNLGTAWWQTPQSGDGIQFYDVLPIVDRIITVTMPDGETHRFRAGAKVNIRPGDPDYRSFGVVVREGLYKFYAIGDTTATLEPLDASNQLYEQFWLQGTDDQDLFAGEFGDFDFVPYNPTRYRLTTSDGTEMILDETLGLLELRDLSGNTLVLDRDANDRIDGITTTQNLSPTPLMRSVTVARDSTGRIDYIEDLDGNQIDYLYDPEGRLSSMTDRELNITQFRYENPNFPTYLTEIIDPRGISAIRSEYDADGRLIKQIDADGNETVFDRGVDPTFGRFEKITDRLGHETTYFYNDRGNITLQIDPLGAQTEFYYYEDTDWESLRIDHYGNVTSMAYDARGNVTHETIGADGTEDPSAPTVGYTTVTTYNSRSAPTSITDPDGRVQAFSYDPVSNDLLTHTIGAGSSVAATTTYTYNDDGSLATVTDAIGTVTATGYDYGFSDPTYPAAVKVVTTTVTDAGGTVLRSTQSILDAEENQLASIVTRTLADASTKNIVTAYRYDDENRLVATILPDGRVSETRYTSFGAQAAIVEWRSVTDYEAGDDSAGRITATGYDDRGNATAMSYPDGTFEAMGYDLENRQIWSQDRRGYRTFMVYDELGRQRFTIYPDDNDGVGDAAPSDPSDGDLADNPRSETVYDLTGRVTDTYDELGNRTQFVYEDGCSCFERRKQSIQHLSTGNLTTSFQYDQAGNVTHVTDPRGNTTETRYDAQGRPFRVIHPATDQHPVTETVTGYDDLGRRIAMTDQEGKITRYRYDGLGRLIEVRQYLDQTVAVSDSDFGLSTMDVRLISTSYTYDEAGNQTAQIDALGRITSYETDQLGRRESRTLPDDTFEALDYDEWGNLETRTDFAGYTTTFGYDALNRLTTKTADATHPSLAYPHAIARIEYDYDDNGARIAARTFNAADVELYTESTPRDARGRTDYKDTAAGRLDYGYYANNLLEDVVSSNADGVNIGYRYDDANRLAFVDDATAGIPAATSSYTYNNNGSLETLTTPNDVTHTYTYDTLNRLRTLNVSHSSLGVLNGYDYTLRASGHRASVAEGPAPTGPLRNVTYSYDETYRLTGETISGDLNGNNGTVTYTLDKVGNRLNRTSSVAVVGNQADTFNERDWLDTDTYDPNGNTTNALDPRLSSLDPVTDTYDFEDRLIRRMKSDASAITISYDADGIRRQKTLLDSIGGLVSTTSYLTDTNNLTGYAQVFEERTSHAAGNMLKTYTYGSNLIAAHTTVSVATTTRYFTYDGGGTVRELIDATGAITDSYDYDAFGVLISATGSTDNAYLYRGEQFDEDIGLYYLRARFMNPDSGRFWNQDTYEGRSRDPITLHKYLYANANPATFLDPSGKIGLAQFSMALTVGSILWSMVDFAMAPTWSKGGFLVLDLAGGAIIGKIAKGVGAARAAYAARVAANGTRLSKTARSTNRLVNGLRVRLRGSVVGAHRDVRKGAFGTGWQSNHVNQKAAFSRIDKEDALAIALEGPAGKKGTAHWNFHCTMDKFWDAAGTLVRRGGVVDTGDYFAAVMSGLEYAGIPTGDAYLVAEAGLNQAQDAGYFNGSRSGNPVPPIGRVSGCK
ncbi:MAG: hypothetical protein SynsKO_38240 [Synoicihabitans sp.]